MPRNRPVPEAGEAAELLAAAMTARGFVTAVYRTYQHKIAPAVWIAGWGRPRARVIYVAPHAGELWFWSAAQQPVAPARLADFAAAVISAWPAPVWVPALRSMMRP